MGAPVSDRKSIFDYLLGHTHKESEGNFFSDDADDGPPNSPYPDSNIPLPSQPSLPNTSQEGNIYREAAQAEPKLKYQCRK